MKAFRKIMIGGKEFYWRFAESNKNNQKFSYLLVTSQIGINAELRIRFYLSDKNVNHEMLKTGFYVFKEGSKRMISLTQPQLIAEIITYVIKNNLIDFDKKRGVVIDRGEKLLNEMGYVF